MSLRPENSYWNKIPCQNLLNQVKQSEFLVGHFSEFSVPVNVTWTTSLIPCFCTRINWRTVLVEGAWPRDWNSHWLTLWDRSQNFLFSPNYSKITEVPAECARFLKNRFTSNRFICTYLVIEWYEFLHCVQFNSGST